MGEIVNYIRVSSIDQNTDRQTKGLPTAQKVFMEKASAATAKRPKLQEMMEYIREGDQVHVYSIDRLARNIVDLNTIVSEIVGKGCSITFSKEGMTFENGKVDIMKKLMFDMLGAFAEFERALIKERQAEGIAAAQAKGKHMGRPPSITARQKEEIIGKRQSGATPTQLAREFGVSRATIYSVIKVDPDAAMEAEKNGI